MDKSFPFGRLDLVRDFDFIDANVRDAKRGKDPLDPDRAYQAALGKRDGRKPLEREVRAIIRIRKAADVLRIDGIWEWRCLFEIQRDLLLILHLNGIHDTTQGRLTSTLAERLMKESSELPEFVDRFRQNRLAISALQALSALRKMFRWWERSIMGSHSARLALWQLPRYAFRLAAHLEDAIEASMDFSAVEAADRLANVRQRRWKGRDEVYDVIRAEYKEQSKLHPEWPSRKVENSVARADRVQKRAAQLGITVLPRTVRSALSKNQKG